jgi:hypothetical protein
MVKIAAVCGGSAKIHAYQEGVLNPDGSRALPILCRLDFDEIQIRMLMPSELDAKVDELLKETETLAKCLSA